MKYVYRLSKPDGDDEIATITVEEAAITITRKRETSTSKGKPTRIPRKLCTGESVHHEHRVQQLKLEHEGFTFETSNSLGGDIPMDGSFLYVVIRKEHFADVIEHVTGAPLPPGVTFSFASDVLSIRDDRSSMKVNKAADVATSVLNMGGGLSALALVLCQHGWADLTHETQPGPAGSVRVDAQRIFRTARHLPPEFTDYMTDHGVTNPGVLQATDVKRAILF